MYRDHQQLDMGQPELFMGDDLAIVNPMTKWKEENKDLLEGPPELDDEEEPLPIQVELPLTYEQKHDNMWTWLLQQGVTLSRSTMFRRVQWYMLTSVYPTILAVPSAFTVYRSNMRLFHRSVSKLGQTDRQLLQTTNPNTCIRTNSVVLFGSQARDESTLFIVKKDPWGDPPTLHPRPMPNLSATIGFDDSLDGAKDDRLSAKGWSSHHVAMHTVGSTPFADIAMQTERAVLPTRVAQAGIAHDQKAKKAGRGRRPKSKSREPSEAPSDGSLSGLLGDQWKPFPSADAQMHDEGYHLMIKQTPGESLKAEDRVQNDILGPHEIAAEELVTISYDSNTAFFDYAKSFLAEVNLPITIDSWQLGIVHSDGTHYDDQIMPVPWGRPLEPATHLYCIYPKMIAGADPVLDWVESQWNGHSGLNHLGRMGRKSVASKKIGPPPRNPRQPKTKATDGTVTFGYHGKDPRRGQNTDKKERRQGNRSGKGYQKQGPPPKGLAADAELDVAADLSAKLDELRVKFNGGAGPKTGKIDLAAKPVKGVVGDPTTAAQPTDSN